MNLTLFRRKLCTRALPLVLTASVVLPRNVAAQRAETARVTPTPPLPAPKIADTAIAAVVPPLTPGRAFLYSFLVPGLAQTKLRRPTAGAIFVFTESIAIAMLRESAADLREARKFRSDSLVNIGNDPATGTPVMQRSAYNDELISIRRGHVEDWIAFLVANHLFAGADAYVAAHLWDLESQINVAQTPTGTRIAARFRW